jgi:L-amino acid N-acyltransferase YncA
MGIIRDVCEDDAEAICGIYNYYIANTFITFEEEPIAPQQMLERVAETGAALPWLVCEEQGCVVGYAYASPWKSRRSYRYTVESTVYVSADAVGRGFGGRIYSELVARLRGLQVHSVIGGIALANPASVGLHESLGFEKVAHFREVGWKMNKWIDVGYWELVFLHEVL